MRDFLLQLFEQYPGIALFISIIASVAIAILGLIPSVFITAANILFFGFWPGILISFIGEVLGNLIAFFLYRKGFKKVSEKKLHTFPRLKKMVQATGRDAFVLILSLRLLPFVPSGLVTFASAIGKVSPSVFIGASSFGKIPALLIEGYAVSEIMQFQWQGKLILAFIASVGIYWFIIKKKNDAG